MGGAVNRAWSVAGMSDEEFWRAILGAFGGLRAIAAAAGEAPRELDFANAALMVEQIEARIALFVELMDSRTGTVPQKRLMSELKAFSRFGVTIAVPNREAVVLKAFDHVSGFMGARANGKN
jgi:hypothetical protein